MSDVITSAIFIPGNVPSSKNSKQWTGKMLISSKTTQKYIKETEWFWTANTSAFKKMLRGEPKPYKIGFLFVRGSKRRFDYVNPLQTVQDLMTKYGWIEDDSADDMIPYLHPYEYDKENPGVWITVIKEAPQS